MRRARLLAVAALAACAADPPQHLEPALGVEVPAAWAAATATPDAVDGRWWLSFEDRTLAAIVDESLRRNHDLRAAAARVEAAAYQAHLAGADLYPWLDATADGARQRQNFIGFPIPGATRGVLSQTFSRFGVGLSASWELDLWGRVRAGQSAALADLQASTADLASLAQSLAAQTARAYLVAVEAELQIALARDTVSLFTQTRDQVQDRVARGIRPALDLRLARSSVANAEAALQGQRERATRARRQLELLLGRYPADEIATKAQLPAVPATVPAGLPSELLLRRPDVAAAERRLAARTKRVEQARAALFPRISLTASAGTASQEFTDLLDGDFFVWTLGGNLLAPIFEGGRLRAEVALREAGTREAAAHYAQTALIAFTEVETALAAELLLRAQETHLAEAEREARAAREIASDRYRRGIDQLLAVLESQRRAVTAASQLIAVRRQILDVRVDLHLALGGTFELPEDAAAETTGETP